MECWERRYRCTHCNAVMIVLPRGVMARYLYSVASIVAAFFLVGQRPVGEGLSNTEAYKKQGMYGRRSTNAEADPNYRWRSLGRWARLAKQWWPTWRGGTISSLLTLFLRQSNERSVEAVVLAALNSHARWGCNM